MQMKSSIFIGFILLAGISIFSPNSVFAQATVTPSVSFVAYPNVILAGKSFTLEWNSRNASVCTASFTEKGENLPPRGSRILSQSVGRQTYTITCTNEDGSQGASVGKTVIVREQGDSGLPLPTAQFGADKKILSRGEETTLFWEAKDAFACAGAGDLPAWLGLKRTSGSLVLTFQTSTTLTLHCWNNNGELGTSYNLPITVTGQTPLSIPEEEFSGVVQPLLPQPIALCDRSATNFRRTKTVQCGRIIWKFTAPTIARLGKDPLPYFYKYHEYYEFLKDYLQFEPPFTPLRITEDKFASSLKLDALRGEIRIPSSMARAGFTRSATLTSRPLLLPITRSMTKFFLTHVPQKSVFLWHPSLQESFADIIGVSAYLARSDRTTQVFWYENWCQKRGKGKLCDSILKTADQFASISQDMALTRQRAIRVPFENLFPVKSGPPLDANGAELFSAVTMLIARDLESVGRANDFYQGLQETMRFMIQWEGFPDPFRVSTYASDTMKRKLNLFVFLISINTRTDFSWYYERFGFPITKETKNVINRFLASGSLDSIAQAIGILAGNVPETQPQTSGPGTGSGLRGLYYDTQNLDDLKVTRTDSSINFDWDRDAPAPTVHGNTFSIRWTGLVEPRFSGEYTFTTLSDDGVRLWVDNKKIIDNWGDHAIIEDKGVVTLSAGKRYPIQLEFFENGQNALIKLYWSSKQQAKEIIPTTQLYPL